MWIPLAINVADWYSQNVYSNIVINIDPYPSPYAVLSLADMPASRQLLTNFVKSDYSVDNTVHNNWQNELNNRGYPQEYGIKNVAISNGSECGIPQEFNPGAYLFRFYGESSPAFLNSLLRVITDPLAGLLLNNAELVFTGILPGSSEYNYDIWAKTIPTGSSQQVYKGRIVYTKKLLFLFPIDVVLMNKNLDAPPGSLPIDTYPGGYYDVEANIDIDALPSFLSDRITHIENFNFIPVTSSLDIGLGELNLDEEDYLRSYSGGNPPLAPTNSPFDNFITAFSTNSNINPNEQHISFQIRNANWLAQELEGESANNADCSFTCRPLRIEGLSSLCSSGEYFIETAADVQWSASPSNLVNISNNGSSNVIIIPSSSSSKGSVTLTATIDSPDCGSRTWTKSIEVGKPQIDIPGLLDPSHSGGFQFCQTYYYETQNKISITGEGFGPSSQFDWEIVTTNFGYIINRNTISIQPHTVGTIVFKVRVNNSCGWSDWAIYQYQVVDCNSTNPYFSIYPNPASEEINVERTLQNQTMTLSQQASISDISAKAQLFDFNGVLVKTIDIGNAIVTKLDVSNFKEGLYFLKILRNGEEEVHQIVIDH